LNPWIEFEDSNGLGFCQPDALVVFEKTVLLVEAKLTWVDCVWDELHNLYKPLLEEIYQKEVSCIAACKWALKNDVKDLWDLVLNPKPDRVWHYIPGR
jgi:hypothetical protein